MATGSAHYSQADNPTVVRDAKAAARVDLSSVRRKYKSECLCSHFRFGFSIYLMMQTWCKQLNDSVILFADASSENQFHLLSFY